MIHPLETLSPTPKNLPERSILRLIQQEIQVREHQEGVEVQSNHIPLHEYLPVQNEVWRENIVEWSYSVVDLLSAPREVVFVFMNILDRFLMVQSTLSSSPRYTSDANAYRTVAATVFLMALKLQGDYGLELNDMVRLSRNSIAIHDMVDTGKRVVQSLTWNSPIPTPLRFVFAYLQLLPASIPQEVKSMILQDSNFLCEISVFSYFLSMKSPSVLALVAFEIALEEHSSQCLELTETVRHQMKDLISRLIGLERDDSELAFKLHQIYFKTLTDTRNNELFDQYQQNMNNNNIHRMNDNGRIHMNTELPSVIPFMDSEIVAKSKKSQESVLLNETGRMCDHHDVIMNRTNNFNETHKIQRGRNSKRNSSASCGAAIISCHVDECNASMSMKRIKVSNHPVQEKDETIVGTEPPICASQQAKSRKQ